MGNVLDAQQNLPGDIDIEIATLRNSCNANVRVSGHRTMPINDEDIKLFELTPETLMQGVAELHGKPPLDVMLTQTWADVYTIFSAWKPVEKTVKAVGAKVVDANYTIVNVATRRYINNSDVTASFKSCFTETVINTVSSTWSNELRFNAGINYKLKFPGSVDLGYTAKCGTEVNRSQSVKITAEDSVNFKLGPKKAVIVHLNSRKNKIFVKIEYEISLVGEVFCRYIEPPSLMTFYRLSVNNVLNKMNKPTVVKLSEVVELDYHSDGEIVLNSINSTPSSTDGYCQKYNVLDYNFP
ncbi:hypothetical protein K1T71_013807 [Dendrolimus kikuchii]|uniref:Uncharacterized protein n=1 Tax=Dendrolimus kikuchii TaxID=765133 RepID=A0ACC1CG21_9NEOP|nr:hypothetical protein K1T71_013807 [Dendrolimus kikuchii]